MDYYKVVTNLDGQYWSASHYFNSANYEYSVRYKVGEFVEPTLPGSKLFVFNNIMSAERFAFCHKEHEVFKVEVTNPIEYKGVVYRINDDIAKFWAKDFAKCKEMKGFPLNLNYQLIPPNTCLCDSIKLVEKICNTLLN